MKYIKKYLLIISFLIFHVNSIYGQFSPYFKNYSISDYKAQNKNWGIAEGDDGKIYFANHEGLLEYDGVRWKLWHLPNKTIVRSVFIERGKIFTGSFEEFGYWERDKKGQLNYTSITQQAQSHTYSEEYWKILSFQNTIFFRSFSKFYSYKNDKIKLIPVNSTITYSNIVNDELLIYTLSRGLLKFDGNKFVTIPKINLPKNIKVNSFYPIENDGLLISSSLNGCFIYRNGELNPWNSEINPLIQKYELNNVLKLKNGNFTFGTIKNGIYLTDKNGNILFHINKKVGLINNTVLFQFISSNNKLWLGLDNGLTSVDLNSNITMFNDFNGDLGGVYDIANFKNTIYIGSNTGLHYLDENNELQFIKNSQGQVWNLKIVDDKLFCGHNSGTYLVENKQFVKISDISGGWELKPVIGEDDIMIQSTYSGFVKFKKDEGTWNSKRIKNFIEPSRFMVFEDKYTAWVAHPYKNVTRVKFDQDFNNVISSKSYENKGISSTYRSKIYKIKNNIVFQSGNGWQRYEPLQDTIIDFDILSKRIGNDSYIISEESCNLLGIKKKDLIIIKPTYSSDLKYYVPTDLYKNRSVLGFEKIAQIKDSTYALCLIDGFALFNNFKFNHNSKLEKPTIESVYLKNELIEFKNGQIQSEFKNNNLIVNVSSPRSVNYFFEYKMKPLDTIWYKNYSGDIEFSNLYDGNYELAIRTANVYEENSDVIILTYHINPPWFRGVKGGILYFILFSLIVVAIYRFNKRKLKRKQRIMKIELEKEQRILLKEKEIENVKAMNKVKNEALASEVKLKSKQLANTAMALIKKNEILVFLKTELLLNKNKFDNQYAFKRLIKQINKSIEHEDEWELFEHNFNQVHKKFFDDLRSEFPSLTHKDLKLCAYIRMNLTTKEIAPLLNISVRGVETHRYRLKKKFQLKKEGKESSLNTFLLKFN